MKSPAFQFYPDDFIGGTVLLSAEDVGAYIRLLCFQWGNGKIPSEPEKLARIAGCQVSAEVLAKFPDGVNARLQNVRRIQEQFRTERSESGKKGAQAKWYGSANGSAINQPMAEPMANGWQNHGSPSPSPSPSPSHTPSASPKEAGANGSRPAAKEPDDEWLAGLVGDKAYIGINVETEYAKMVRWCDVNRKNPSRKRFIAWLNRVERPMQINGESLHTQKNPKYGW